jgi:4-diphosphocytidyl-2-C-methyl-D-erythritol kinase
MFIDRYADDWVIWAPAKVNLFLEVLGKRPDGYHEIATLMVTVGLFDTLVLREGPAGAIRLRCTHAGLTDGQDNLVVRAAHLLREHTGCGRGAEIRLIKRIPLAAGLAGGSTDAAATLAGLNRLWRLGLARDELAGLAARLGSDVPFFLHAPAAWCTGRGEHVVPISLGTTLHFVLLCPPFGLSTADVYRKAAVPQTPLNGNALRHAVEAGAVQDIGRLLHNRLQEAAFELRPELARYRQRLAQSGAAGWLMSGSGSTFFALCRGRAEARRLARDLRNRADEKLERVYLVRSCSPARTSPNV